jgi:hypothetical protein
MRRPRPRAVALPALVLLGALATAGCGAGPAPSAPAPRAPAAAAPAAGERVVARDARLRAGRRGFVLLSLDRVGELAVDCDARGPAVAFRADRLLATSDVVVAVAGGPPVATTLQPGRRYRPAPPAGALLQTWHVAPFAAAGVRLLTMTVAGRRLSAHEGYACAVSARAELAAPQGATRTG